MGKNLQPKCKQCRRANEKLFLKGDRCKSPVCAMVKRNYPPGFHGPKGVQRRTDYGTQLNEKQKAKRTYCILEKQFRNTFEKAKKQGGNAGDNFIILLESRFDNVVYRSGIASSRSQARQLVNHGHFTVNDKKVDIPSYEIKQGDVIKIKNNKKNGKNFKNITDTLKKIEGVGWLHIDPNEPSIKVLHEPKIQEVNPNFNVQMIIEFYSK